MKPSLETQTQTIAIPTGDPDSLPVEPLEELTPEGADAWAILLPDLINSGVFRKSDALMLVELCEMLGAAKAYRAEIRRLQPQLKRMDQESCDPSRPAEERSAAADAAEYLSGRIKRARTAYLQTVKQAQSLAAEFGVSPVARIRLGLMRLQGSSLLQALGNDDD